MVTNENNNSLIELTEHGEIAEAPFANLFEVE